MEDQQQPAQPTNMQPNSATTVLEQAAAPSSSGGSGGASSSTAHGNDEQPGVSGVHLVLMCLDTDRHVTFQQGVIDNEGMNRRKSKCCCIYHKPHAFGESSSSSDDECEHCCGHPEVRVRNRLKKKQQQLAKLSCCGCHCHHCQPAVVHVAASSETPPAIVSCSMSTPVTSLSIFPDASTAEVAGDNVYTDNDKVEQTAQPSLSLIPVASKVSNRDDSIIT